MATCSMASLATANALTILSQVPSTAVRNTPSGSVSRDPFQVSLRRTSVNVAHDGWRSALRWTNSRAFGKAASFSVSYSASSAGADISKTNLQVRAFTPEQSKLVKESWKMLQKDNPGKHALTFFLKVFEIAPSVKRLFGFLKDTSVPLEKNPKLKIHALQVFVLTGESASQLGEKGALDAIHPKLLELGRSHATYGVVDEHFDVVKFALLTTIGEALPDKWTPEMKGAWSQAYDELVACITDEMKAVREGAHSVTGVPS